MGLGTNGSANGLSKRFLAMVFTPGKEKNIARDNSAQTQMDFDLLDRDGYFSRLPMENDIERV